MYQKDLHLEGFKALVLLTLMMDHWLSNAL